MIGYQDYQQGQEIPDIVKDAGWWGLKIDGLIEDVIYGLQKPEPHDFRISSDQDWLECLGLSLDETDRIQVVRVEVVEVASA